MLKITHQLIRKLRGKKIAFVTQVALQPKVLSIDSSGAFGFPVLSCLYFELN